MKPFNLLRWLTLVALLATMATGAWIEAARVDPAKRVPSDGLIRRSQLGFHRGLTSPMLAAELARTPGEFRAIFGDAASSVADRGAMKAMVLRDFGFIPAYTLLWIVLGLRTWHREAPHPTPVRLCLVALPLAAAVCDLLENRGTLAALAAYPDIADSTLLWGSRWSWAKWLLSFVLMILLGGSLVRVGETSGTAAFLRDMGSLILLVAGVVGLFSVRWPSSIGNAMLLSTGAGLPFLIMVLFPDSWWRRPCTLRDLTLRRPPAGN